MRKVFVLGILIGLLLVVGAIDAAASSEEQMNAYKNYRESASMGEAHSAIAQQTAAVKPGFGINRTIKKLNRIDNKLELGQMTAEKGVKRVNKVGEKSVQRLTFLSKRFAKAAEKNKTNMSKVVALNGSITGLNSIVAGLNGTNETSEIRSTISNMIGHILNDVKQKIQDIRLDLKTAKIDRIEQKIDLPAQHALVDQLEEKYGEAEVALLNELLGNIETDIANVRSSIEDGDSKQARQHMKELRQHIKDFKKELRRVMAMP